MKRFETLRVLAVFADPETSNPVYRITPVRFRRPEGEEHRVRKVRRIYRDQKGDRLEIHFIVETESERFFDLLYDVQLNLWKLVMEFESLDPTVSCSA